MKYKVYAVPGTFCAKCSRHTRSVYPLSDSPCALCQGPHGTALCRTEMPYCVKAQILNRLDRCTRCIGFHSLEMCHCRWPCTKCGGTDHHEVLCTVVPRSGYPMDPPHFSPWGQRLSNGVGCSGAEHNTEPRFFGESAPSLHSPSSTAPRGHSQRPPYSPRGSPYKRRGPSNTSASPPRHLGCLLGRAGFSSLPRH